MLGIFHAWLWTFLLRGIGCFVIERHRHRAFNKMKFCNDFLIHWISLRHLSWRGFILLLLIRLWSIRQSFNWYVKKEYITKFFFTKVIHLASVLNLLITCCKNFLHEHENLACYQFFTDTIFSYRFHSEKYT